MSTYRFLSSAGRKSVAVVFGAALCLVAGCDKNETPVGSPVPGSPGHDEWPEAKPNAKKDLAEQAKLNVRNERKREMEEKLILSIHGMPELAAKFRENGNDPELGYEIALRIYSAGLTEKAVEFLNFLLKIHPNNRQILRLMARCQLRGERPDSALIYLQRGTVASPLAARDWEMIAECYYMLHQFPKSVDAYAQTLYAAPNQYWTWHNLSLVFAEMGQKDEANECDAICNRIRAGEAYPKREEIAKIVERGASRVKTNQASELAPIYKNPPPGFITPTVKSTTGADNAQPEFAPQPAPEQPPPAAPVRNTAVARSAPVAVPEQNNAATPAPDAPVVIPPPPPREERVIIAPKVAPFYLRKPEQQ